MAHRFVSGIPILERQADQRWGHLAEYQAYKRNTPELIPRLTAPTTHPHQNGGGYERISSGDPQPPRG